MKLNSDSTHIPELDGLRALAILLILWFHLWQQSWLMPIFSTPFLSFLGIRTVNLDFIPRTGYLLVDFMLLLSGFLLYLPWASLKEGEPLPSPGGFYVRRLARILPGYLFCVLLLFFGYALPSGAYGNRSFALKDLFSCLTFTNNLFPETYLFSKINPVLWTVCVEMQFYLLFPLIARGFQKRPTAVFFALTAVQELYLYLLAYHFPDKLTLGVNQLCGFFGVFALGMLAAKLYAGRKESGKGQALFNTLLFFLSVFLFIRIQKGAASAQDVKFYQATMRLPLSLVYAAGLLSLTGSFRWLRRLFSGPVLRYTAKISYALYIWHQWFSVHLKEVRIPYWEGDVLPNMAGNRPWQWKYTVLVMLLSFAFASLVTFFVDKPGANLIKCNKKRLGKEE